MSTVPVRQQSRQASKFPESQLPQFSGHAAIACLVLGCGWTVYSNVFGASIYPSMNSAAYRGAGRQANASPSRAASAVEPSSTTCSPITRKRPARSRAPVSVAATTSIMFNERFAAFAAAKRSLARRRGDAGRRSSAAARAAEARSKPPKTKSLRFTRPCRSRSPRPRRPRRIQDWPRAGASVRTWRSAPRRR